MNNNVITVGQPGQEVTVDLNKIRALYAAIKNAPEKTLTEKLGAALEGSSIVTPSAPYSVELAGPGEGGNDKAT